VPDVLHYSALAQRTEVQLVLAGRKLISAIQTMAAPRHRAGVHLALAGPLDLELATMAWYSIQPSQRSLQ